MNYLDQFKQQRSVLFSLAYRMLGSIMDAEDIMQEAFLKWEKADRQNIKSPKSYLSTIVMNLCLDYLGSARRQREEYYGTWLPEPFNVEKASDLPAMVEKADTVSMAFMLLLEKLTPIERAVFLLREVFEYDYAEISEITGKSEANCRQILHRASEHLAAGKTKKNKPSLEQQEKLFSQFVYACQAGDMQGLVSILEDDIVLYSDGGGKVHAAKNPVYSSDKVARFFISVMNKLPENYSVRPAVVNGQPALVGYSGDTIHDTLILEMNENKIQKLYFIGNPDKLKHSYI